MTDASYNRLPDVPVLFRVVQGEGSFENQDQEVTVETDSDGRAIVPFILGPEKTMTADVVEALVVGMEEGPKATFVGHGRAAGEPELTAITGIVLDNSNQPIPGVTLRILDTAITTQSDDNGLFRIQPAPVGTVKLIADGSTASPPGPWPDLEFTLTTIAGRDNDLGMPIFLLPLDLEQAIVVDETRGGTVTLTDVPGFALDVAPGSVTFPGGGKSGVVSATAVHSDKIPMVPNFGQQPRLIVTIQPAGARFDPPARLTLPNVEALAPGMVTELYSFDHDLGHFVSIGPATVSDDGLVVVANPGVGILKAGWHCGGFPAMVGTPNECPECAPCNGSVCEPVTSSVSCDDGYDCTFDDHCEGVDCVGTWVEVTDLTGPCIAAKGEPVTFTATSNHEEGVMWNAPSATATDDVGQTVLTGPLLVAIEEDRPPTVSIVDPVDGAGVVEGSTLQVVASAIDDLGIERVRVRLEGLLVGEDLEPPYEIEAAVPVGVAELALRAEAVDTLGQVGQSEVVQLGIAPDPLTTIFGRVLSTDGLPVAGAVVETSGVLSDVSGPDGFFSIAGVPSAQGDVAVFASVAIGNTSFAGSSGAVAPIAGGITDVGDIELAESTDDECSLCVEGNDACDGASEGDRFQSCETCQGFVECVDSGFFGYLAPVQMPCNPSLVWDDNLKSCASSSSTCNYQPGDCHFDPGPQG